MTTLVEFQKLFPVFLARAGKGFQIFNFDSGRSNSQQNLKFQDVLYQGHARFFCKDPPNLHLDASSYPKPDFNICVGSDKAELFSQTFFFIMPGESHLSARSPSTNQNFSTVTKRDSCRVCALPIGAEVMVKSEAPPHKLCQPWSTGSLKISTQNYTLKHIHAFVFGNSLFPPSYYCSDGPGNRTQKSICMPGKPSSLVLTSSLPLFHHINHG